jgi:hypothetical protein
MKASTVLAQRAANGEQRRETLREMEELINEPKPTARANRNAPYLRLIVIVCLILIVVNVRVYLSQLPSTMSGRSDFRHLYVAGYMLRTGHARELYSYDLQRQLQRLLVGPEIREPLLFNHAAFEALAFVPFSFFSYRSAFIGFTVLNFVMLVVGVCLFRKCVRTWSLPLLITAFASVVYTLIFGQDSVALLLLFLASWICFQRGAEFSSGLWIGASCFKPQFAFVAALVFLLWRRWQLVLGIVLMASIFGGMSVWMVGLPGTVGFMREVVFSMSTANAKYAIVPWHMPNVRGTVFFLAGGREQPILTLVVTAFLFLWAAFRRPSFPLAVSIVALLSYHTLMHDMVICLIPLALILEALSQGECQPATADATIIVSALLGAEIAMLRGWSIFFFTPLVALMFVCATRDTDVVLARRSGMLP